MGTSIIICSQKARNRLYKLRYMYQNVQKDMFMDKYKQSDIVENCSNFLKLIEKLKLYMIEFNKNNTIKPKAYPFDYRVKDKNK